MKSKKTISLRLELLFSMIGSIIIVALFLSVPYTFLVRSIIKKSTLNSVNQTMETLNEQISGILGEYNGMVKDLSNSVMYIENRDLIEPIVTGLGKYMPESSMLYFASSEQLWEGGCLYSSIGWNPPADFDMQSRGWHKDAIANQDKLCYTSPYTDENTKKLCVTISYRVLDSSGKLIGVSAADIVLDSLSEVVKSIKLSENSKIHLVTKEGFYLTNDDFSAIMNQNYFDTIASGTIKKESYLDGSTKSFIDDEIFYGVHQIASTDWFIVVEGPESDFSGKYEQLLMYVLFGLCGIVFILLIAAFLMTQKIMSPLKKMVGFVTDFVASLENGGEDYSPRIKVTSRNEIGRLAESINLFISKLGMVMAQIHESQEKEHRISANLFEEAQNLVVSAKETAATSQDSAAAVKEIVATMEDTNDLSENISRKIKDVSGVANSTSSDVIEGVAQIELNVKQLHEIFDANQGTIDGIKNLSEKIESIWDIVSLINNVADQAKIIAFNAELEASTAGEAGKSFRIVANEIRRLSDGIIDGTREIKEKITEVQHSSDSLILASESSTAKINAGYENARDLDEKFNNIKKSAEITAKSADDIADIIQQQAVASEQILIAIKEIAAGVENFTVATDNISGAAENVRKISEDLNNASSEE